MSSPSVIHKISSNYLDRDFWKTSSPLAFVT